jgi:putative peptidoglycan lipid II flippase
MLAGTLVFTGAVAALALRLAGPPGAQAAGPSPARIGAALVPLLLLSAAATVNVTVERGLAARLPEGSLAALTYAYRLLHFPLALFMTNATTMLLPALAGHAVRGEAGAVEALTQRALRIAIVFVVPLAALALALAEPLTRVVLERGAFTAGSTAVTATAIAWYAPGIVALALAQILVRAYQASHALWRLAWTVGAGIAVNVVLMAVLASWLGFVGLPLASTLSAFALVALMLAGLRGRVRGLGETLLSRPTIAVAVAGVAAAGAAWMVRGATGGAAMAALVAGAAAGLAVYAAVLGALAPAEARAALALVVPAAPGRPA